MWKVTNNINYNKLLKFQKGIIEPLFTEIINYKTIDFLGTFAKYIDTLTNKNQKKILKEIIKRKDKKISFGEHIEKLIANSTKEQLRHLFALYIFQNRQVKQQFTSIYYEKIPVELIIIFKEFFYKKFFDDEKIWRLLDGEPFSRTDFHNNFKKENSLIVCPYCDIDTTINIGNNQIEHFWPKSVFPFIAMNGYNLISSCSSCNMPFEGKGTKYYDSITMPYFKQIGEEIEFQFDLATKSINITAIETETKNYLELLNLYIRYANPNLYNHLFDVGESLYSTFMELEKRFNYVIGQEDVQNYIKKQKIRPLYFATLDIFKQYDLYQKYCRDHKTEEL